MSEGVPTAVESLPAGQAGGTSPAPAEPPVAPSQAQAAEEQPASGEQQQPGVKAEKPPAEKAEWIDRRITRLAEQKAAARAQAEVAQRRAAELEQRLAQYETPAQAPPEQQVDPYRLADQIAEIRVRQLAFNRAADDLVSKGHEVFDGAEFDGAVRRLQGLGAIFEDDGTPTMVLTALMDSDEPHEVLMYLGSHPDEAESLSRMNPRALIRAVAKLENKIASSPPARISKAPAPVRPVGGRGGAESGLRDSDDIKLWMEKRRAQLAKKR